MVVTFWGDNGVHPLLRAVRRAFGERRPLFPVYGTSLEVVLDAALDSGGDFFRLEIGRLDRLDGPVD